MEENEYNPRRLELEWLEEEGRETHERRCSCNRSRYSLSSIVIAAAVGAVIGIVGTLLIFYASHPSNGTGDDSFCRTPSRFIGADENATVIDYCYSIRAENMSGSVQETINNLGHCNRCRPRLEIVHIPIEAVDNRLDWGEFRPRDLFVPRCPNVTCYDDKGIPLGKCCPKKRTNKTFHYYVEYERQKVPHTIDLEVHDSCVCKRKHWKIKI